MLSRSEEFVKQHKRKKREEIRKVESELPQPTIEVVPVESVEEVEEQMETDSGEKSKRKRRRRRHKTREKLSSPPPVELPAMQEVHRVPTAPRHTFFNGEPPAAPKQSPATTPAPLLNLLHLRSAVFSRNGAPQTHHEPKKSLQVPEEPKKIVQDPKKLLQVPKKSFQVPEEPKKVVQGPEDPKKVPQGAELDMLEQCSPNQLRVGDRIAYKVLELGPDYSPQLSDFRTGRILEMKSSQVRQPA